MSLELMTLWAKSSITFFCFHSILILWASLNPCFWLFFFLLTLLEKLNCIYMSGVVWWLRTGASSRRLWKSRSWDMSQINRVSLHFRKISRELWSVRKSAWQRVCSRWCLWHHRSALGKWREPTWILFLNTRYRLFLQVEHFKPYEVFWKTHVGILLGIIVID